MHFTIAAIVYAKDEKAAAKQAEKVFGYLSCKECGRPFDYWTIEGNPVLAGSKEGQKAIEECMKWTKAEFMMNLGRLRAALAKQTDEQVYSKGPDIYLYDNDAEGIREPGHLKNALEKWPSLDGKETRERLDKAGDVWVVTADAHA
jgi:hypothetical protein